MSEDTREKFVLLIVGSNGEKTFGLFFSIEDIWKRLTKLGFARDGDTHWCKGVVDAYIKHVQNPDEMGT